MCKFHQETGGWCFFSYIVSVPFFKCKMMKTVTKFLFFFCKLQHQPGWNILFFICLASYKPGSKPTRCFFFRRLFTLKPRAKNLEERQGRDGLGSSAGRSAELSSGPATGARPPGHGQLLGCFFHKKKGGLLWLEAKKHEKNWEDTEEVRKNVSSWPCWPSKWDWNQQDNGEKKSCTSTCSNQKDPQQDRLIVFHVLNIGWNACNALHPTRGFEGEVPWRWHLWSVERKKMMSSISNNIYQTTYHSNKIKHDKNI